jgi:hypothetical protein
MQHVGLSANRSLPLSGNDESRKCAPGARSLAEAIRR